MQIFRAALRRTRRLLIYVFAGTVGFIATTATAQPTSSHKPSDPDHQIIGPGKVVFEMTRSGRWQHFIPSWSAGRSLIRTGGILVLAEDADGVTREIANTKDGGFHVVEKSLGLPVLFEGMPGGFREPSPNPDDDGDGRVDEDRVDGIDNDRDGKIDEDFAAIGDEMIVTEYKHGEANLHFYQEAYAWSLPHIDGAVMMSLRITNSGLETLRGVHVAAFIEQDGPVYLAEWGIDAGSRERRTANATIVVGSQVVGGAVVLVGLPPANPLEPYWSTGFLDKSSYLRPWLLEQIPGGVDLETYDDTVGPRRSMMNLGEAYRADLEATSYVFSPRIESLAPGEEVRFDMAILGVRDGMEAQDAATVALETYIGDGKHRYLPPPVSLRPRVIWGSYVATIENDDPMIRIVFDELGRDPVSVDQVSFFTGIDPTMIERRERPDGGMDLFVRGETVDKILEKNDRATFKGRLDTGEFFEAILKPTEESDEVREYASKESELFWKTPGKLEEEHLLSGSPNPFRDATTIYYEIPSIIIAEDGTQLVSNESRQTTVKVYNVAGRLIATLVDEDVNPGTYSIPWGAIDEHGSPVASGVYYVKLQVEKRFLTKRLILLK